MPPVCWLALPGPSSAQLFGGVSQEQEIELGREAAAMIERWWTVSSPRIPALPGVSRTCRRITRHFSPDEPFSLVYVHHPYLGIFDSSTR